MLGDFNVDFARPGGNSNEGAERRYETAALVGTMGLRSIRSHYRSSKKRLGRYWTWRQKRDGVIHGSEYDHILTNARGAFTNCQIKIPRFDTDHSLLVGTLRLESVKHHRRYVRSRGTYPVRPPGPLERNRADGLLDDLREAAKKEVPDKRETRNNSWISEPTWRLVDQKAAARRRGESATLRVLKKSVRRALRKDRKARAGAAAAAAQAHLERGHIGKAFGAIKGWYRDVGPRLQKPSREDINYTHSEYEKLFAEEEPSEDPIPIHNDAISINDAWWRE